MDNKILYVLFPVLGLGQEQKAAGQCPGNYQLLNNARKHIFTDTHTLVLSMRSEWCVGKTLCPCSWPFFRPKKSSSSCSSSCMESKRMLMVSTSTRGSRILERNLLAPPGVLVWFSTPKRLCSLLYTSMQTQTTDHLVRQNTSVTIKWS